LSSGTSVEPGFDFARAQEDSVSHLSIFNIGTEHDHSETSNLLVKLFHDCPSRPITATGSPGNGDDHKVINDGVGASNPDEGVAARVIKALPRKLDALTGDSLVKKSQEMFQLVKRLNPQIVTLVGHSRGAVAAVRTAALLWKEFGTLSPDVNLWLLDPVKFSARGTHDINQEIHANVKHLRIVVMEDTHDICGYKGGFKLLHLENQVVGKGRRDIEVDRYIRMPGSHGTGSQVDGNPIGEVTFQIARRDLAGWHAPVGAGVWSEPKICNEYFGIHRVNEVTKHEISSLWRLMGGTELSRKVNDNAAPGGFKTVTTDSRARRLDGAGVHNRFRGHLFFINEHHFTLFRDHYPALTTSVLTLSNNADMTWEQMRVPGLDGELARCKAECDNAFRLLQAKYGARSSS
jgi:hypothetical protein